jgi:predicted GIY-YIG superfamily endonuclease
VKYVYLLRSRANPSKTYVGLTDDPARRLEEHNSGKSTFTARHLPWEIEVSIRFEDEKRAANFERYLKTGSGIAFARKHFW